MLMYDKNLSHISGAARLMCARLILMHSPECSKYLPPCRECSKESLAYLLRCQGEIFFLRNLAHISCAARLTCALLILIYTGVQRVPRKRVVGDLIYYIHILFFFFRLKCALLTASYAAMPSELLVCTYILVYNIYIYIYIRCL
jgi:hypothetical protein